MSVCAVEGGAEGKAGEAGGFRESDGVLLNEGVEDLELDRIETDGEDGGDEGNDELLSRLEEGGLGGSSGCSLELMYSTEMPQNCELEAVDLQIFTSSLESAKLGECCVSF